MLIFHHQVEEVHYYEFDTDSEKPKIICFYISESGKFVIFLKNVNIYIS